AAGCAHPGSAAFAVPDLIDEIAVSTLHDGGQVQAVPDPPDGIAAYLRSPPVTARRAQHLPAVRGAVESGRGGERSVADLADRVVQMPESFFDALPDRVRG